jgi:hypothetical protein
MHEVPRKVILISLASNGSPSGKTGNESYKEFLSEGTVPSVIDGALARLPRGLASRRPPPIEVPEIFNISLLVSFMFILPPVRN